MLTDHTEYDEYHKLQLSMVFRYQHNNTLCKTLFNYRYRKNPPKYRDIIFFQYRTPIRDHSFQKFMPNSPSRGAPSTLPASTLLPPQPSPHWWRRAKGLWEDPSSCRGRCCTPVPGHSWKICQGSSSVQTCRTTSALTDRAYSAAGQADSVLHSMAALQVFQAMDESVPGPATFKELSSATDLALCATKTTANR